MHTVTYALPWPESFFFQYTAPLYSIDICSTGVNLG